MVEFAIILPLLLLLLFGVTELGRALYQQNTLYKTVVSGARYLARTGGTLDEETCEILNAAAWTSAMGVAKNIIAFGNAAGSGTPRLPNLDEVDTAITITRLTDRELTKTDGTTVGVCAIMVTSEVPFAGIFGELAVPNLYGESNTAFSLRAETEERYIGR